MRLTRIVKPFDDPDYIFELKHDGFRALAYIDAGDCKLISRNLNRFKSFESLKKLLDKVPVQNAILDGEIVCLDPSSREADTLRRAAPAGRARDDHTGARLRRGIQTRLAA